MTEDELYRERREIDNDIESREGSIRAHERELAYLFRRRAEIDSKLLDMGHDEHETAYNVSSFLRRQAD